MALVSGLDYCKYDEGTENHLLKERQSETYKWSLDILKIDEHEKPKYYELYSNLFEVPISTLSYDGSVLGDANLTTKEIRVAKELDPFTKEMVKTHEKLHIKHPELSELQIRIETVNELEMKGKYVEAEIARRFVHMMAGIYRYN